jgi:hypothetical protein
MKHGRDAFQATEKTGLLTELAEKRLLIPGWEVNKNEMDQNILHVLEHTLLFP